ncbi:endonuclease/exonuclease/phosphatase family protein [Dyadobacter sp. CY261]|uniref:endonuclease/exonuclease/phosphatase family protein n=1 Tax=Dyadobacter sp. CY261 TaxID=2907203 RepID=UPI001F3F6740|nr:endonuclease/exonuclease/phosphatase family protein [Dyadobacter sp. CY261]MCF0074675.1 endonuclease/exonuclease/phosphatase family protein [Dyadobacter sp. CY261]
MYYLKIFLEVAGSLVVLMSLVPLIRNDYWTFRVFEYPRLQKLVLSVAIAGVYLSLFFSQEVRALLFSGAFVLNSLYLCYLIFPFTPVAKKAILPAQSHLPENRISILSSNVLQDNKNASGCLNLIRKYDPDIVLLLETDRFWYESTLALREKYPYEMPVPLENTYGMLLYSRLELSETQVRHLVDDEIPSIKTLVTLLSGQKVQLFCVHPTPPVPGENLHSTERDKELLLVAKEVKASRLPCIVVGDLNDVAWSYTTDLFTKISGLLDPRLGRGFYNTFHAGIPLLRFPLDHVFCSTDFKLVEIARLENFSSDHFPILLSLQYEPAASIEQDEPEAEPEDIALANEKISKES